MSVPSGTLVYTRALGKSKGATCEVLVNGEPVAQLVIKGVEVIDDCNAIPVCRIILPLEYVDLQGVAPGPRP